MAQIAAAAVAIADRGGLSGVTMRAVARALDLAPAALYRYVASRDELVAHMVEAALEALNPPRPTGDVGDDLVALAAAQVTVLQRHPWLVETLAAVRPGARAIRFLENGLLVLSPVHVSGAAKLELLALVTGVATLFARAGGEPVPGTEEALLAASATHPHLATAFADPGVALQADELLDHTVRALLLGLLKTSA